MKPFILAASIVLGSLTVTWASGPTDPIVVPVMSATEVESNTSVDSDGLAGLFLWTFFVAIALTN
jgi:hypothetical protein